MSQLRHDPLSGRDVIIASGRASRPTTFSLATSDAAGVDGCPFCPGREAETPPEVARTGDGEPNRPGWEVRAFPNLFPIVDAHEVVVLSPDHDRSYADLDDAEAIAVLAMLRDRLRVHLAAGHVYGLASINHLRPAGASIVHPHAQLFALEIVPRAVQEALGRVRDAGGDLVRADVVDELVVAEAGPVRAWCPPASPSPHVFRIAHDSAAERFDLADDTIVARVAIMLRDMCHRMRDALGDVPYNMVVYTAPSDATPFHWYVEVMPRVTITAGFEYATGILVNPVPPLQAAETLRGARPS